MVENISVSNNPYLNNDNTYEANYTREKISYGNSGFIPVITSLTAETGRNFFRYLKRFSLSKESNILIIYPNNHYYYDEDDLKSVKTLINLKKLDLIKDLDTFLETIFRILPPDVNFIGCFSDKNTPKGNRLLTALSVRFNNLIDSRTEYNIDKNDVSELLVKNGFKVIDITVMDGLTYFYSQKVQHSIEIMDLKKIELFAGINRKLVDTIGWLFP